MNKENVGVGIVITVLLLMCLVLFVMVSQEDFWVCEGGHWVQYGNPTDPVPDYGCELEEEAEVVVFNFQECVQGGYPIMESYPRQCRAGEQVYIENIGNEIEKLDLIRIDYPRPNQEISSPLLIEGEARGTWFFEASFPVILTDWDGRIIASSYASALDDWMTEDFVRFEAELDFDKPELYNNGSLILQKDNPSGLPELDDALEIPIYFE